MSYEFHRKTFQRGGGGGKCLIALLLALIAPLAAVTSSTVKPQIDQSLKNAKLIESKILPDASVLMGKNDDLGEKWKVVRRFIETGFPALESYGYKIKRDVPYTLIIPRIELRNIEKPRLKEFMLEHLVVGKAFESFNKEDNENGTYGNGNGHKIVFRKADGKTNSTPVWLVNGFPILYKLRIGENLIAVVIDGYLGDRKSPYSKRNIQDSSNSRYNEPQPLEMRNVTSGHAKVEPVIKESKESPMMSFLSAMKLKVFQHLLSNSSLTGIMDTDALTVLVPNDSAFQRWHPIDWGFYPFSVHEFSEKILHNHFLPTQRPVRLADIKNMRRTQMQTLGGSLVEFDGSSAQPTVNNVTIISEHRLTSGSNILIIKEVLFVTEQVVSNLHQMHKDKETPPLLAFPWFGAQFLSHSFLALERDPRFSLMVRFLNNAELAQYISGANYTLFVPNNNAFEALGFDKLSDAVMGSQRSVRMLLQHFVRGRLYYRDLRNGTLLDTVGGGQIRVTRNFETNTTYVNGVRIIEGGEVFVYNLGTMFYIEEVLFPQPLLRTDAGRSRTSMTNRPAVRGLTTRRPIDIEILPNQFEHNGGGDYSLHDEDFEDEIITPKVLPVRTRATLK